MPRPEWQLLAPLAVLAGELGATMAQATITWLAGPAMRTPEWFPDEDMRG
ncbi:hypothetical protein [Amycolatopsis sp. NPDC058986]